MVNLFRTEDGPCFLGADCWVGNVCYKASEAGLELLPVFAEEQVVFALLKCEKMVAAIKMERDASDADFIEQLCALSLP